ncbi:hypothetical protein EYF80_038579 [Liparis tanakae]|uniref:Uncharacterized protein n=1 Tax=Liparis tanakae TaxID=230148 RepID=A0A4Z2GDJ5_9TELE|nr:hypothetical protein EYF80_038579 [Liparis tanakae]
MVSDRSAQLHGTRYSAVFERAMLSVQGSSPSSTETRSGQRSHRDKKYKQKSNGNDGAAKEKAKLPPPPPPSPRVPPMYHGNRNVKPSVSVKHRSAREPLSVVSRFSRVTYHRRHGRGKTSGEFQRRARNDETSLLSNSSSQSCFLIPEVFIVKPHLADCYPIKDITHMSSLDLEDLC